jgi:hypothetical protein
VTTTLTQLGQRLIGLSAVILMGIGIYFVFFRPALLPEDLAYIGSNQSFESLTPRFGLWLHKVFIVLGGFIFSTGLLKLGLLNQQLHQKAVVIFLSAWAFSIGTMSFVNFVIRSDFRWSLFALALMELVGIALLWISLKKQRGFI